MGSSQMRTAEALIERRGQCTILANVLMLTQNMVYVARDGDWDAVAEMESDRRALLHECFAKPVPEEHSELFAEALAAMLHLNEELLAEDGLYAHLWRLQATERFDQAEVTTPDP